MAPGPSVQRHGNSDGSRGWQRLREAGHRARDVAARTPGKRRRPEGEEAPRGRSSRSPQFVALAVVLACGLRPHFPAMGVGQPNVETRKPNSFRDGQSVTLVSALSKPPNAAWLHIRADSSSHSPPPSALHDLGVLPATRPGVDRNRMAIAAAGLVVTNVVAYAHFHKVWWDHPRTGFHLYRGWRRTRVSYDVGLHDSPWYHVDKCGHLFSASLLSRYGAATARCMGFSPGDSDWVGFALASLLMLEIEVYDGFFAECGFSLGDMIANQIGAALPMVQRRSRLLQGLNVKLSYWPSGDPVYGRYPVEDYGGMTFWLCVDAHMLLPPGARLLA